MNLTFRVSACHSTTRKVSGRPVGLKPGSTGLVAGHALDSATRTPKVGGYPREFSCFPSSLRKRRWTTNFRPLNSKGIFKGQRSTHPIFLTWYRSPLENISNVFQMNWTTFFITPGIFGKMTFSSNWTAPRNFEPAGYFFGGFNS